MSTINWKTEKRKVSKLIPFEKNPRKITPAAMEKLKDRILKRGFHDVIKVDTKGVVLSGNMRTEALLQLGIEEVTVLVPDRKLTKAERDAVMLESNRNDGEWDEGMLIDFGSEILLEAGFDTVDVHNFIVTNEPKRIKKYRTKRGEMWQLGDHKFTCGMELDSSALDIIIKWWETLSGQKAKKI